MTAPNTRWRGGGAAIGWVAALVVMAPVHADQVVMLRGTTQTRVQIVKATFSEVAFRIGGLSTLQTRDAKDVAELLFESQNSSVVHGKGALEMGKFAEAVRILKSASALPGKDGHNASYLLGVANLRWGAQDPSKYRDAVTAFQEFILKINWPR